MAPKTRSGKLFGTVVTKKVIEETMQVVVSPKRTELETNCENNDQRVVEVVASSTKANEKIEVISSPLKEPVRRNIVVEDRAKGAEQEEQQQKSQEAVPKDLEEQEKALEAVTKSQEKQQGDDQDETQPASEPETPPIPPPKYEAPPNIEQQRDDQKRQPRQEDVDVGEEELQEDDKDVDEQELQKEEDVGVGEEELQKGDVEGGEEELEKEDEDADVDKDEVELQKIDKDVDEGEEEKRDEEEEIFVSASESEITTPPTPPPQSESPANKEQKQQQQGDEEKMQPDVALAPTPPAREGTKKRKTSPDIEESAIGEKEKKPADTQRRKKRAKMGSGGDTSVGYKRYVFRVMKQVHPELAISSNAMTIVNNLMSDMFERIAEEASRLSRYSGRRTLSPWEIQDAVKLVLPGELGKHAIAEGSKAVSTYASSVSGQSKKSKS